LFSWMVWQKRKTISAGISSPGLSFEGILLLAWWLVVLGVCVYAFALGMGG
jgi:hypothetical protein